MSWGALVVEDRKDLVALYLPENTPHKRWRQGALVDAQWWYRTLRLMFPGRAHSVWLSWQPPADTFLGYYVNLEEPFRRTSIGFDTNDHSLDVVVAPDWSWSWKDKELFDRQVHDGDFSAELAAEVMREAESVIAAVESRSSPFSDGWDAWLPDPAWTNPVLPENWNNEPPAQWDRRVWAYPRATDRVHSESG